MRHYKKIIIQAKVVLTKKDCRVTILKSMVIKINQNLVCEIPIVILFHNNTARLAYPVLMHSSVLFEALI